MIHALLIGPEGTPYAGGCFLFDILLPPEYPSVAPLCTMAHTGGVRLNPNLYPCGKVCLSLLGTWEGPGWDPAESTLLQVLVSILGMVLVPDPFFNEPGYESQSGSSYGQLLADEYARFIRLYTMKVAVVDVLTHPHPAFTDVIAAHFRLKRDQLLLQAEEWLGDGRGPPPQAPRREFAFAPVPYGAPHSPAEFDPAVVLDRAVELLGAL